MKKLLLVPVLLAATLIPTTQAQAADIGQRICEYVQANDKSRLRSFLKQNKLKLRSIYDDLKCNGDNLLIFAAKSQSLEVGEFIIGKLPSKKVKVEVENIAKYSAHLAEEAKDR